MLHKFTVHTVSLNDFLISEEIIKLISEGTVLTTSLECQSWEKFSQMDI